MVILAFVFLIVAFFLGKQYGKCKAEELNYLMNGKKTTAMITENEDSGKQGVRIIVKFVDINGKEQLVLSNTLKHGVETYPIGKKVDLTYILDGEEAEIKIDNEEKDVQKKNLYLGLTIGFAVLTFVCFAIGSM